MPGAVVENQDGIVVTHDIDVGSTSDDISKRGLGRNGNTSSMENFRSKGEGDEGDIGAVASGHRSRWERGWPGL